MIRTAGAGWFSTEATSGRSRTSRTNPSRVDRCNIWYLLKSYLVKDGELRGFLTRRWSKGGSGAGCPKAIFHNVYIGEYPWHPSAAGTAVDWTDEQRRPDGMPTDVLLTSAEYAWSVSSDQSLDNSVSGSVPSSTLLAGMQAYWSGTGFDYVNPDGSCRLGPKRASRVRSCLAVDPAAFDRYLERHGYALVWVLLGEKS